LIKQILLADLIWFLATIPILIIAQVIAARWRLRNLRSGPPESMCFHCERCHAVTDRTDRSKARGLCVRSGYCAACLREIHQRSGVRGGTDN
jgi:hypothetical protein